MQAPANFTGKTPFPDSSRRPLILVGASVRAAAQSAVQAGFSVIGIDRFADTDTLKACVEHHLIGDLGDRLPSHPLNSPTEVMQVGGFEDDSRLLEVLGRRHRLRGVSRGMREDLQNPKFLATLAQRCGLSFPPFQRVDEKVNRRGPLLRKNPRSSGGLGIRWVDDTGQRGGNHAGASRQGSGDEQKTGGAYLQQWVAGRSFGASWVSDGHSARLLGVCRSTFSRIGGLPFVYAGSSGPVCLGESIHLALGKLGQELVRWGLVGLFNADLIVDRAGVGWLLEINPRWSGSSEIIERSMRDRGQLGQDESLIGLAHRAFCQPPGWLDHWAANSQHDTASAATSKFYLKSIAYARTEMRLNHQRLSSAIVLLADDRIGVQFCDLPADGSRIAAGEPILSIIVSCDRTDHAGIGASLRRLIAAVQDSSDYSPRSLA